MITLPVGVQRHLVLLICSSLLADDVEHLSYAFWLFAYVLWRNVYSGPLPTFYKVVFLLLSCKSPLHILDTSPLLEIGFANIFFHPVGRISTFLMVPETQSFNFAQVQLTKLSYFLCFWRRI